MAVLEAKHLLTIDTPVGAAPTTRLRRYRVSDPYLRFWLRFVAGRLGDIERGRGELAAEAFHRGWTSWRGRAVEPVVRSQLWRAAPDLGVLRDVDELGGWWDRHGDVEIDIVAAASKRIVGVGTITWREGAPVDQREMRALDHATSQLHRAADARRIVVCPAGVVDGVGADVVWTAEDVVSA